MREIRTSGLTSGDGKRGVAAWPKPPRPSSTLQINGRKRHIATDTLGLMLFILVHAADVQDRDGAPALLQAIRHRFPWLRHIFADGGYAGGKLRDALKGHGDWTIEIIKRSDTAKGFEVLPRRWVVERTLAWLGRCRRLAKDAEKTIEALVGFRGVGSVS